MNTHLFKVWCSVVSILLLSISCNNNPKLDNWDKVTEILNNINPPEFPNNTFMVTDFGAKADLTFNSKSAIQTAIDSISKKGGGKVIVPQGTYFCVGSIFLKDNVNLHLEENAVIKFSTNPDDYLPVVLTRWEGMECYNYSPLLYAEGKINIAITGKGTFDGAASAENWWPWKGKKEYGFTDGMPSQLDSLNRPGLQRMNIVQLATEQRIFGDGHYLRPNFLQLINCKNIIIEGVTFKDSPMWFLHPVLSENITVRGVKVVGKGPNNDGLNPESCKNVLIEDCYFDTGDDCIAIKSGRNGDGRRINIPSENFVIRNCKMKDGHGGVVIGSEISGGCKNIYVEDCVMDSPHLDRAIRIKTNTIRGGVVENIFVRNITVGEVKEAILKINLKYEPNEIGERNFPPKVRNIYLSNVISKKSKYGLYLDGLPESVIENIYVEDSKFDGVADENFIRDIENLNLSEVYINGKIYKN